MPRIYVIDQNVMQRPMLPEFISAHPDAHFALPDTALVEMCQSDQWEYTFRKNLAPLAPVVTRCMMSLSVQEARELEVERKTSVEPRLLPSRFRPLLRGAILGSQLPAGNDTIQRIRADIDHVRTELKDNDLNAAVIRNELKGRMEEIRQKVSAEHLKLCRQPSTGRAARALLALGIGDAIYQAHMRNLGVSHQVASRLKRQKCMTLRWAYMLAHHALQWIGDGGFDAAPDKAILNDALDQDYVLIASFFDGIVTYEEGVRDALEDLRAILALPQAPVDYH